MTNMKRLGAKVTSKNADHLRQNLLAAGVLDHQYHTIQDKDENKVIFPLTRELSESELKQIQASPVKEVVIDYYMFSPREHRPTTLQEALSGELPNHLQPQIPSAIDFVGDLAILDLPSALLAYSTKIGEAIMRMNPQLSGVFHKVGAVSGQFRLRQIEKIAGESRTATIHHENGCRLRVDIAEVYFSGRLSTERLRVVDTINPNSLIFDMFAGVGPFTILAARKGATVVAVDINPQATLFLQENTVLNKVQDRVTTLTGDIRTVNFKEWRGKCDHVIMNLPGLALQYLDIALEVLKSSGGMIHLYCFQQEPDLFKKTRDAFTSAVNQLKRQIKTITDVRKVKMVAPREWQMCIEAEII